jgi:cytochrome P450
LHKEILVINASQFAADSLDERASDRTINRRDFAQLILEAISSRDGGDYLTPDEGLIATVILIITGTVTTSIMLTCITYVLGKHQDVKEKLFQELVQAVPEKNSTIRLVTSDISLNQQ